ncbi:hypothetical protein B0H13DRAFT_2459180 [Mycena leptocephala]|nr:hypothetical protein B0H13DRAFT_2459180 [Mycena leptocephala]
MLCVLAFWVLHVLCLRTEAAFWLAPHLFASAAVRLPWNNYDRYLHLHISRAHLVYVVRLSTGWMGMGTGTGVADADLMKTEKRAPGNGNADEDGLGGASMETECRYLRVHIHPSPALRLSLRFGAAAHAVKAVTYCPPALIPPSFVFALALALVPAFACILAPTLSLVSVMPASTWCGVGRAAAVLRVRAHPLPHRPPPHHPSRAHLSSLDAYGYARAVELERGAGSGVHVCASAFVVALAQVVVRSRQDVRAYARRHRRHSSTRIRSVQAPRI